MRVPDILPTIPLQSSDRVRFPEHGAAGWEPLVAAANHRRHADAVAEVTQAFGTATPLLDPDAAAQLDVLVTANLLDPTEAIDLLDHLLTFEDLRPPHLAVDIAGTDVDDSVDLRATYDLLRPDVAQLERKMAAGAALLLRWIDEYHARLSELCEAIETITGAIARVELLRFTPGERRVPGSPGAEDRILVVVDGCVDWHEPTGRGSTGPDRGIFVPRGTDARFVTEDDGTLLVVDIGRTYDADLIDRAMQRSIYYPLLRADFPHSVNEPTKSYETNVFDRPNAFDEQVREAMAPVAFDEAAAFFRASLGTRSRQSLVALLQEHLDPSLQVRVCTPGGVMVVESPDGPFLSMGGVNVLLSGSLIESIAHRLDGRPFSIRDLEMDLAGTGSEAEWLVRSLAGLDLVDVAAP